MDSDEKIKLTDGEDFSSLVIKAISQTDQGNYTCTAKNLYGADSMTTQVIVQCKCVLENKQIHTNHLN